MTRNSFVGLAVLARQKADQPVPVSRGLRGQACNRVYANGKRLQGLANRREDPVWGEKPWCLMKESPAKVVPWWQRMAQLITFKQGN